jgi:hypothetical protein
VSVNEGGVYAILEPEVQQERRATGNGFILVVNKPEHFLLIGRSKDFVPCRATNKVRAALALAIGLRTASARLVSEAAVCVCVCVRAPRSRPGRGTASSAGTMSTGG